VVQIVKTTRAAWIALTLIGLTQAMSMVDRQILAILLPRIKADLQVGDAEMGLLYGSVFALFYALFSLPLGRLADGWKRGKLISLSIAGWSAATAMGGMANSYAVLALSRLGIGIGEASVQPAGFSLLSDHFPKEKRGTVTAVIAAAIALGLGAALFIGGATADWWDNAYKAIPAPLGLKGWQAAFIVASLPGFVLAVFLWRMEEPVRGAADGIIQAPDPAPFRASWDTFASIVPGLNWLTLAKLKATPATWLVNLGGLAAIIGAMHWLTGWTNALRKMPPPPLKLGEVELSGNALQWIVTGFGLYVVLNWLQTLRLRDRSAFAIIATTPALVLLFTIAALQSVINYAVMAWAPTFLIKSFGLSPTEVGLKYGALVAIIGIFGPLIAGPLSDWVNARIKAGRLYVTLISLTISPFFAWMTFHSKSPNEFYLWFSCFSFFLTMWLPPVYASFMDLVLPRIRGSVMSFYILTMTIVGLGLGPYAVGLMSDVNGGDLGSAILSVYWLGVPLVILIALLIWRFPADEAGVVAKARAAGEPL
jgi:MFS transporter, Spinster family, sphingosine-1-phosphate transporter